MNKILEKDFELLNERITALEKQMFDLGQDFNEAVNQSSETWHDNAPFDVVRDRQSILHSEISKLKHIRRESIKFHPKKSNKISIGARVICMGEKLLRVYIGGYWVGRDSVDGYVLVSSESPIALELIGKKQGDFVLLPSGRSQVTSISYA